MRGTWTVAMLAAVVLAGCLAGGEDAAGAAAAIGAPIVMEHDHTDLSLHTGSYNLDFVAWNPLGVTLGDNGFANFVLHEDGDRTLAFVAVDGDSEGGFVIADVTDPHAVQILGRYWVPGNGIQEVRVTPDGRYAVMNVQAEPDPTTAAAGLGACSVCIHIVDVQDRGHPTLVGLQPVELLGTHNFDFEEYDDGLYLFYVGQPLLATNPDPVGNEVTVARFTETPAGVSLVPVSRLYHDQTFDDGRSFPHDVMVQDHPDGRKVAYVSHWQGGFVAFDVTDPLAPGELSVYADPAPSTVNDIHWIMQEPAARADGTVLAWSVPEIGELDSGSGVVRAMDVTDPAMPAQLGTWTLPGEVTIPDAFLFSPHTAVPHPDRPLLAVSHYHAGVWVLDTSDPAAPVGVAYSLPHTDPDHIYTGPMWWKKPNFDPDGFGPNVYQARWDLRDPDLLWVTDRGTGLYALEYTGPHATE